MVSPNGRSTAQYSRVIGIPPAGIDIDSDWVSFQQTDYFLVREAGVIVGADRYWKVVACF